MPSYYTSESLIEDVKRRAHIPESQVTFQTADFLAFANEEMKIGLVPSMLQFHEEFFTFPITIPMVQGQNIYQIPSRALGGRLRAIFYLDSMGNPKEMARIQVEDLVYYQKRSTINYPSVFYLQNNSIVLVPGMTGNVQASLQLHIFMRPNELVESSRIGMVTNVNTVTGEVTLSSIPSVFSLGSTCDFIETIGSHRWKAIDKAILNINTTTKIVTFNPSDLPFDLAVGDHIALSGETFVPQVPDELHPVLSQRIACRCLEAQNDQAGLQAANQKLSEMEIRMGNLIDQRTEGNPQKVLNLRGPLRQAKIRRRRNTW